MSDAISAGLHIFADPESVDRVAASYVELLNAIAAGGGAASLAGIRIHCDSCGATTEPARDAHAALDLAQEAGWLHDFTEHSDLCPDCRKDLS